MKNKQKPRAKRANAKTSPQKKDFRYMAQSLKDEEDTTKKLYHRDI